MKWDEVKKLGSGHYKSTGVEPIDLYKEGHILHDFAIGSIIKYAYRNRSELEDTLRVSVSDMRKIIHYAEMLIAMTEEVV